MSTLQLTPGLIEGIQRVLEQHDHHTTDAGIAIQYLAAIVGALAARYPADDARRREILHQLFAFTERVFDDHLREAVLSQEAQSPYGPGFGVWRPK